MNAESRKEAEEVILSAEQTVIQLQLMVEKLSEFAARAEDILLDYSDGGV